MPASTRYQVTHPSAPRQAADPLIGDLAEHILAEVKAATPHGPTGDLAAGWELAKGRAPAVRVLSNPVPYTAFVEFGTKDMAAEPALGPVLARYRGLR